MSETQRVSVLPYARRGQQINVDVLDVRTPWQIRVSDASANLLFSVMLVCIAAFAGCQQSEAPDTDTGTTTIEPAATDEHSAIPTQARSKALAAKDALFNRLSGRLAEVVQANGPAAAIEVCSREATEIAASVGEEQGVKIGRTAIRLRNPQNAAPEWVQPFVEQRATEPRFATLPNGDYGALLPIKLKSKCLACHGPTDAIAADVKAKLAELYPHDQATGFGEGDLRGWFWVVVPAEGTANDSAPKNAVPVSSSDEQHAARDSGPGMGHGRGMGHGPGMGRGRGMMGRGRGSDMRVDMATLHAMFDDREKIKRTVRNLPNGAEATTESDDKDIAALIQEHVPAMETRVHEDQPLPPMTFHPVFVELIRHADDYTLTYEETDRGMKVTYAAEDPFVIMLVQEHARLVSRFIKNGMEEIHKPYTLPEVSARPSANASELQPSDQKGASVAAD